MSVPEVDTGREMTGRLSKWIGRQSIEYTYAEIAKQVKVDEKTVRNIFDEYVTVLAKEYLCLATMDDEYETRIQTRVANIGVALPTLERAFDSGKF